MRPRREVSPLTLWLLYPLFRRCWARDGWILRVVGNRWGPVLIEKRSKPDIEDLPERLGDSSGQQGRFARTKGRAGAPVEDGQAGVEAYALKGKDAKGE